MSLTTIDFPNSVTGFKLNGILSDVSSASGFSPGTSVRVQDGNYFTGATGTVAILELINQPLAGTASVIVRLTELTSLDPNFWFPDGESENYRIILSSEGNPTDPEVTPNISFISGSATSGIMCDYPYMWTYKDKTQMWRFDCHANAWVSSGFSLIEGGIGAQGDQGAQGFQGFTGPTGAQGFQGFQGFTGPTGHQGFQGFQGFTGPTGAQGFQGFTGPTGPQGFQGFQGFTGPTGVISTINVNGTAYSNQQVLSFFSDHSITSSSSSNQLTITFGSFMAMITGNNHTKESNIARWTYVMQPSSFNGTAWTVSGSTFSARNLMESGNGTTQAYGISVIGPDGVTLDGPGFSGFYVGRVPTGFSFEVIQKNGFFFFSAVNPIDGVC
jgi:hypothetical protein